MVVVKFEEHPPKRPMFDVEIVTRRFSSSSLGVPPFTE
jgi:hypothetical protein